MENFISRMLSSSDLYIHVFHLDFAVKIHYYEALLFIALIIDYFINILFNSLSIG